MNRHGQGAQSHGALPLGAKMKTHAMSCRKGMFVPHDPSREIQDRSRAEFLRLVAMNSTLRQVVDRITDLELLDTWVAGGCLFQTAWNILAGEDPTRAIKDYDVFYFDPEDCTKASEENANLRAAALFADVNCRVDVRNQARVHLWYAQEFGVDKYPRLRKSTDGIDIFLAVCCMVGIRTSHDGRIDLYAPLGVEDVLSRTMRPNPWFPHAPRESYKRKAARWRALWPELVVEPFSDESRATAHGAA